MTAQQFDAFAPEPPRDAVTLMQDLALKAGPGGITVDSFRVKATQLGMMTDVGYQREYAWLGSLAKRAGLKPTNERRRSILPKCHGNLRRVWVHERFA